MKTTPNNITELKPNQVFVFGSNSTGFHGAGAAGLACRGDSKNTWRKDEWFLKAMKSSRYSKERIGKWAVYGMARGFQVGNEGMSYAIETIKKPGFKRSTSLMSINYQIKELFVFTQKHQALEFYITKLGSSLAGYTTKEIGDLFRQVKWGENVWLPKEYQ